MTTRLAHDILLIFLFSVPALIVFRSMRLPSLLAFIATGAVIGPQGFGLVSRSENIALLAEWGVALLLFSAGLEFSLEHVSRMKKQVLLGGALQIAVTVLAGTAAGFSLGFAPEGSFYLGCVAALSSTAVVLATMHGAKTSDSLAGRLTTGILILQDLALVPMLLLLHSFGKEASARAGYSPLLSETLKAILVIALLILFTRHVLSRILRYVLTLRSRDLFVITVALVAMGMAELTEKAGLSIALGAFLGGFMIGNTDYKFQALADVAPFRTAFNSLFFVSVGMLLDFRFVWDNAPTIAVTVLAVLTVKTLVTSAAGIVAGTPLRIALVIGLSLSQIGEFSFLLAQTAEKSGVIGAFARDLTISVTVVLMLVTPPLVTAAPALASRLAAWPWLARLGRGASRPVSEPGAPSGHVMICGFGPLAKTLGIVLEEFKIPFTVLDLNPRTVEEISARGRNALFGDGTSEEILYQCGIERARLLAITVPDFLNASLIIYQAKRINPGVTIITRSRYRNELAKLYAAGADIVISEEEEAGVEMGRYVLAALGFDRNESDIYVRAIREDLQGASLKLRSPAGRAPA